jgi:hypothetical protein
MPFLKAPDTPIVGRLTTSSSGFPVILEGLLSFNTKQMIVPINNNHQTRHAGEPMRGYLLLHMIEGLFNNFLQTEMLFTANCL